ncbi:hypothetical protein HPB50_014043 [Hyalomma asiaticum]|uniref:Uncharacterized protein n=1 Tax=Hyalomma asiaticum TaxID=266040 RepID=A0ACB7TNZ1_HYAAI|nr:hypothetical protein HPB50_014043 [Hyalomma asiaticum]
MTVVNKLSILGIEGNGKGAYRGWPSQVQFIKFFWDAKTPLVKYEKLGLRRQKGGWNIPSPLDTPQIDIRNKELAQELLVNSGCEAAKSSFPWVLLTPSWLPGTVQDTIWRFGWAVLPTADRMCKWHYVPTVQCVNCRKHESIEHALLKCRFAVTFWSLVGRAFRSLGVERFINGGRCPNSSLVRLVLAAGLFSLWENRSCCLHLYHCLSSPSPREGGTLADTMPSAKEHFNTRTLPGTSVDEIIDALEALVGTPEIYSLQHPGGQDFQVGVNF